MPGGGVERADLLGLQPYRQPHLALNRGAYDSDGDLVMVWEKTGARYVWQITDDDDDSTITFHGQGSATVTMTWEELRVTDG